MSETKTKKTNEELWAEISASINTIVNFIGGFIGFIFVVLLFIKGVVWFGESIYIYVNFALIALFLVITFISLLLAIFKKSRGIGGIGIVISSTLCFFALWLSSLMVGYIYAGKIWLIIGLIFVGIGVIPVALISTLIQAEWSIAGQIILMFIIVVIMRIFAGFLFTKSADLTHRV